MGIIRTSTTDINGNTKQTEVRVGWFGEFLIRIAGCFGRENEWRMVHIIEHRKLNK